MKKTISVSLGGSVFVLEEDAYNVLSGYLKRLELHFSGVEGMREIISDIELRIAEHLKENIKIDSQVVDLIEINRVIRIMGEPGEMDGGKTMQNNYRTDYRNYRRMYRDVDDRILGGVCSGMGSYWRVEPLVFRIIFIVTLFWGGLGLLTYLILWVVIPPALTTAQKLEMRGEPVTADNIGKSFYEPKNS
jgi:phage shock protein PspC (stress-responsive transcriptional regulator)